MFDIHCANAKLSLGFCHKCVKSHFIYYFQNIGVVKAIYKLKCCIFCAENTQGI